MKVANAAQMRALDQEAIEGYGIPGMVLMENAALGVVRSMEERYGLLDGRSVQIVCGKGNNGGDGMAVARHLANRGAAVGVLLLGDPEALGGDAGINYRICRQMNIPIRSVTDARGLGNAGRRIAQADLIVDAILGTGIVPPVRGLVEKAVRRINKARKPVVSVDLPSGLSADSSEVAGAVIEADLTVTFGLPKISLAQFPSLSMAGEVRIADISLPTELVERAEIPVELLDEGILQSLPPRRPDMHKGDAGRVLIVGGSHGMPGASVMAALAAFRVGTGLVYAAVPDRIRGFFNKRLMEGIVVPVPEKNREHLTPSAVPGLVRAMKGKNALALGPGIGLDPETGEMIRSLLPKVRIPLVIDADGLTHLAGETDRLRKVKAPVILTPHPGEMVRLTGLSVEVLETHRVEAARDFAGAFGVIVVLKGARSVVADPGGRTWINTTGNPGMATAGTGDVLTGMIVGFLGQGMKPLQAALAGVYLHGSCGDRAAGRRGTRGLLSRDLIREIPFVLQSRGV